MEPNIQLQQEPNIQPQKEKVYKTPAYIRKAVKAYIERQKEHNKEKFTERKRGYDKKYYAKFKKNDSSQVETKN